MKKILIAALLCTGPALANPIILHNTGEGFGSQRVDTNWTVSYENTSEASVYVTKDGSTPVDWAADTAISSFISPKKNYDGHKADPQNTVFTFDTTFTLTNLVPTSAFFTMRLMVDNQLESVSLNGHDLAIQYIAGSTTSPNAYQIWSPTYMVNQYFKLGVNTLQFKVYNAAGTSSNPTGLRVEFLSSSDGIVPTPEPATLASLMGGLGLFGLFAHRTNRLRNSRPKD